MGVICKACKKSLDDTLAYEAEINGHKCYFCSYEEYAQFKHERMIGRQTLKLINDIFGYEVTKQAVFFKEFRLILEQYTYADIHSYLVKDRDYLTKVMQTKGFKGVYNAVRYFMAILRNNVVKVPHFNSMVESAERMDDVAHVKYQRKGKRTPLTVYEEGEE